MFIVVFTALWVFNFNATPPPSTQVLVAVDLILLPDGARFSILDGSIVPAERDLQVGDVRMPRQLSGQKELEKSSTGVDGTFSRNENCGILRL